MKQTSTFLNTILDLISKNTSNSVIITDSDGYVTWVNDGFTSVTGYEADDIIGKKPSGLLQGPDTNPATRQNIREALETTGHFEGELLNYHRSGNSYWIHLKIFPFESIDGETYFFSISRDITNERESQQSVARERLMLRTILDNNWESIYLIDTDFNLLEFNKQFYNATLNIYGHKLKVGENLQTLMEQHDPERIPHLVHAVKEVLECKKAVTYQRQLEVSGVMRTYEIKYNPVIEHGSIHYITVFTKDITLEKEAEHKEIIHKLITDNTSDLMVLSDMEGACLYVTPSSKNILDLEPEEIIGSSGFDNLHPEDAENLRAVYYPRILAGESVNSLNVRLKKKDGSYIWVESNIYMVKQNNQPTNILSISRVLDENVKMHQSLLAYKEILENVQDSIITLDMNGVIQYWNKGSELLYGWTAEEMVGESIETFDRDNNALEIVQRVTKDKRHTEELDWQVTKRDGTKIWVKVNVKAQLDRYGNVVGAIGVAKDITELRRQKQLLDITNKHAKVGGWRANPSTGEVLWTNETYAIYGLPQGSPNRVDVGLSCYHPDDRPEVERRVKELFEKGTSFSMVSRFIDKQNNLKWVYVTGMADLKNGNITNTYGSIQDITEKKNVELLIHATNSMAKVGAWEYDVVNNEGRVSEETLKIYGLDPEAEMTVDKGITYYHPEDAPHIIQAFEKLLKTGEPYDLELRLITEQGNNIWVRTQGQPLFLNGKVIKAYGSIQDITDQKNYALKLESSEAKLNALNQELEELVKLRTRELTEANEELETYNYMLSHDLKTPLRVVSMFHSMLQRSIEKPSTKQQDFSNHIQWAIDEMEILINDAVELLKLKGRSVNKKTVNWTEFIEEHIKALQETNPTVDIQLTIKNTPRSKVDPRLFSYVLRNLISNAISYRKDEQVVITIDTRTNKSSEIISISDNGIGFDQTHAERIFQPYVRLKNKQAVKGSGLGLSIANRVVSMHGGEIIAKGKVNKGAKFSIKLPLID